MEKLRSFIENLVLIFLMLYLSSAESFGYSSNSGITVNRQMPVTAVGGETIVVEITVSISAEIPGPINGFYFTDHIPEGITVAASSYAVTLNGSGVSDITDEIGRAGDVYPDTIPSRLILETPPDFSENNFLHGGDELKIIYQLIAPADIITPTAYFFPGFSWCGRIQGNPTEEIFGYEDITQLSITVVPNLDVDLDGILNEEDNCPETPNGPDGGTCIAGATYKIARPCMIDIQCGSEGFCSMNQEDSYGYGIGDACYFCEADFSCDGDVDAEDARLFLMDFGRNIYNDPCRNGDQCFGDFECNGAVDSDDIIKVFEDFGRNQFNMPCPDCKVGDWCLYE